MKQGRPGGGCTRRPLGAGNPAEAQSGPHGDRAPAQEPWGWWHPCCPRPDPQGRRMPGWGRRVSDHEPCLVGTTTCPGQALSSTRACLGHGAHGAWNLRLRPREPGLRCVRCGVTGRTKDPMNPGHAAWQRVLKCLLGRRRVLPGVNACPGKFTKWRTKSWPFSQAAWPTGHYRMPGAGHPGMWHWPPPSLPCVVAPHPETPQPEPEPLRGTPHGEASACGQRNHGPAEPGGHRGEGP